MIHKYFFLLILCLLSVHTQYSQNVAGIWKTIDDKSGKPKALVRLFTEGEKLYGKVEEVLVRGAEDPRCIECEGALKDKPIEGMTIIDGVPREGPNEWKGEQLLNPEEGRWYRCRIWLDPDEPDVLKVRGYLAFFYRTQRWYRQSD